ncbi:PSD1 and planctomycete cytochrome C domain-containing protein [Neorhodopirellula pilleata]|uniref:Planctomycete cytochrome C n=1 Tax=Neorhodopirellula pilleata TaxID=2714738 RepID=A0A5C6AN06_9BACT|nr:PSD1 and planctomycete cytochrome C domain-containing protein [Neorhodopirellula pilleata]TWU01433.1 Planctomycete cytochrome C [Neorhodopirellula pilleata]
MMPKTLIAIVIGFAISGQGATAETISFSRDVLPILSDRCFQCHGPDEASREAGVRLDLETTFREVDFDSILDRIEHDDPDQVMPPPETGKRLSDTDKTILKRWLAQDAPWEGHWSYQPIVAPEKRFESLSQAIDGFVSEKLHEKRLNPNPAGPPLAWLRRVTFDLTGLPPTLKEVESFQNDPDYEAVVDRLLASVHFGERMAWDWLEAARYADTHGFQKDNVRTMWAWRDWVIDAFNDNMPFDQFTIKQLAGDLLPDGTLNDQIATGFNRNHRINAEAGAIDEEYRVEYVIDRTDTFATVWMGMTAGCARCHDHKFDPLTQKEYYQLFAFFNNIDERGNDGVGPTAEPDVAVPIDGYATELVTAVETLEQAQDALQAAISENETAYAEWLVQQRDRIASPPFWMVVLPDDIIGTSSGSRFETLGDGSVLFSGANPLNDVHRVEIQIPSSLTIASLRLEALPDASLTDGSLARSFDGDFLLSELTLHVDEQRVGFATANADVETTGRSVSQAIDEGPLTGWSVGPGRRIPATAKFDLTKPLKVQAGQRLAVALRYESREEQYFIGRFRLSLGVDQPGSSSPMDDVSTAITSQLWAAIQSDDEPTLRRAFADSSHLFADQRAALGRATSRLESLKSRSQTRVMVMRERTGPPRPSHVLARGLYDQPGEMVIPDVPEFLGLPLPNDRPRNRLTLAEWLVDPRHPLTSRVAVNRFWQIVFGRALVGTPEDFGKQGEQPSHPKLLDYLAEDFKTNGWNVKRLIRSMALSETYRRDVRVSQEGMQTDPENRWLARGTRHRLPAPAIRDQSLALSGLLVNRVGGPPVRPWQPPGLWQAVAGVNSNTTRYEPDADEGLFRRSLYTFWKRGMPPPNMMVLDSANREVCNVRITTTNSPLQALTTLNDLNFVIPTIVFADRMMRLADKSSSDEERLQRMWLAARADNASRFQLEVLSKVYGQQRDFYASNVTAAKARVSPALRWLGDIAERNDGYVVGLAAATEVAEIILNSDGALCIP